MFDTRQTNRSHWLIAQTFILTLFNLFGSPQEIAEQHTYVRDQWRLISKWLRAGEALMRHLLLIEAAALPKPNTRPLLWKRRLRKRRERHFFADKPEDWRVSFRVFTDTMDRRRPRRPTPTPASEAPAIKLQLDRRDRWHQAHWRAQTFHSAWPLAERAEALLRVFNNPAPYAKRLAARLHATPHRAPALLRCHPDSIPLIGEDHLATIRPEARRAAYGPDTS